MIHIVDGKPYVQSLHNNVSLEGNTVTVRGDAWYTYVIKFKISDLR